jgi:hypothetical protein
MRRLMLCLALMSGSVASGCQRVSLSLPNAPDGPSGSANGDGGSAEPSVVAPPVVDRGVPEVSTLSLAPADDREVKTTLPPSPRLTNVRAVQRGDGVDITFDPVEGAQDYRVYVLPSDPDLEIDADGTTRVRGGIYRCAGKRANLFMRADPPAWDNEGASGGQTYVAGKIADFERTESEATLGYVFAESGPGRVPVYAIGDKEPGRDTGCGRAVFFSTRTKTYTTDANERDALVRARGRNDGVVFYVPETASVETRPIYSLRQGAQVLMYGSEGEARARMGGKVAFHVLREAGAGRLPLQRVHVTPYCTDAGHDELVAGMARFAEVRSQGDRVIAATHYAGLKGPSTLVVEALDAPCPYQGPIAGSHGDGGRIDGIDYPEFRTLEEMQQAFSEVYVGGQGPGARLFSRIPRHL